MQAPSAYAAHWPAIECELEDILEFPPVGKPGERIMGCVIAEFFLHGTPGGHIPEYHDGASHHTGIVFKGRGRILDFVTATVTTQKE